MINKCSIPILTLALLFCSEKERDVIDSSSNQNDSSILAKSHIVTDLKTLYQDSVIFGQARALNVQNDGTIYILDDKGLSILRIDNDGKNEKVIDLVQGKGPGEVITPNSLYIDREGNFYLTDRDQRKFVVLDKDGKFINENVVKFMPSRITASSIYDVYVTGFRFTVQGSNLVTHYKLNGADYIASTRFVEKFKTEKQQMVDMSGYSDFISVVDSLIIFSSFYPYNIDIFNFELNTIASISDQVEGFKSPYSEGGLVRLDGFSREVLILKDWILVRYLIQEKEYFNIYNKEYEFISSLSFADIEISEGGKYFASSGADNSIYGIYENPALQLIKYVIQNNQ